MKLSLVVPCYNEEDVVYDFYKETNKVFADKVDSLFLSMTEARIKLMKSLKQFIKYRIMLKL